MAMEWYKTGFDRVAIPDDLVDAVIEIVDMNLDPYRDFEFQGAYLATIRDRVARAVASRRALLRSETLAHLGRTRVEPWMADAIAARERRDRMLVVLEELTALLDLALQDSATVHVIGD